MALLEQTHDNRDFRLPGGAVPRRYELTIAPDLAATTFTGRERIDVEITAATHDLVCNAADLEVTNASLQAVPGTGGSTGGSVASGSWPLRITLDPELERLTFHTDEEIPPGTFALSCEFSGVLNDKLRGFYRSTFKDADGAERTIAATQFESIDARRAFPCWDEPEFKAVFSVALEVDGDLLAISNGAEKSSVALDGGRRRVEFTDTIPMSTYLVAFIVGPLEATDPVDVDGVPLRIVYPPGKGHLTAFALECGAHALRWFAEYFDQPYPGDKMDLVAIPDFAAGAMENLGCVTFRETALLTDPERSSRNELEHVAGVIEHEIAHMWFGDLVTMRWWNGIWLNEAFATYMSMACLDDFRPEYQCWTTFGRDRDMALALDALHTTRPIEFPVRRPRDAEAMFDLITYEKGGSLLRMVECYLGTDRFRDGVRRYLAEHLYGNTETTDLWDAIEAAAGSEPIRSLMDSWILQGGHPLVTAAPDGDGVVITQEPFASLPVDARPPGSAPSAIGSHWLVPIAAESRPGGERHYELLSDEPLRLNGATGVTGATPAEEAGLLVLNAGGSGVYRLRYEGALLDNVLDGFDRLEALERYTLVADTWACTLSGTMPLEQFLALSRRLASEEDPSVWSVVTGALGLLDLAAADEDREALQGFVRSLLGPELDRIGWDRTADDGAEAPRRRAQFIAALGTVGSDPAVHAEALRRFEAVDAGVALDPDTAMAIIQTVASAAGPAEYEALLRRYRNPADPLEEQRYLDSLASVRDLELAARTCELCASEVRSQDAPFLLRLVMMNRVTGPLAWEFMTSRWDELVERFPGNTISRMLGGVVRLAHLDEDGRPIHQADIVEFCRAHPLPGEQRPVEQHLERLAVYVRFVQRLRPLLGPLLANA